MKKYGLDASPQEYWVRGYHDYQSEEIEAVLQEYFTELYHLPQPYKTDIEFHLENAPGYRAATPAEWRERGFDHGNMVDFISRVRQRKNCLQ